MSIIEDNYLEIIRFSGLIEQLKLRCTSRHNLNRNNSELLKEYFHIRNNNGNNKIVFDQVCKLGFLNLAKWLYCNTLVNLHDNNYNTFRLSCLYGHIDLAKWIFCKIYGKYSVHVPLNMAFLAGCKNGHMEIAKWVYELGGRDYDDNGFIDCCKNGHLDMVKWLYGLNIKVREYSLYVAFSETCINGHIDVAKWLYNLGIININLHIKDVFEDVCRHGQLEIAKWLYNCSDILNITIKFGFIASCSSNNLELTKWLYSIDTIDININQNQPFRIASVYYNLDLAKWLYEHGAIIDRSSAALRIWTAKGDDEIPYYKFMEWLNSLEI